MKKALHHFYQSRYFMPFLLFVIFASHILAYINTTTFHGISEAGALLGNYERIMNGARPSPLYGFYWFFTPAYIAYGLTMVFGSLHAYFVFQCLLSVLAAFIAYRITLLLSNSRKSAFLALLLVSVFTEFSLLSSVFYTQVYEILFAAVFLWMLLKSVSAGTSGKSWLYLVIMDLAVMLSLLFRNTLIAVPGYLFILGVYLLFRKKSALSLRILLQALLLGCLIFVIKPLDLLREGGGASTKNLTTASFWGHTTYGGKGGEVGFIYPENEKLFNQRLGTYAADRGLDASDPAVAARFRKYEVNRFITQEPHRWALLQAKKFFYTFGIIPSRDSLKMLVEGRLDIGWLLSAALLQIPFVLIMILFLAAVGKNPFRFLKAGISKVILYSFGLYLISAICFYGTWSERYRIVIILLFFIPVIAINLPKLGFKSIKLYQKIITAMLLVVFLSVWAYQAHEVMVTDKDRYFGALDRMDD